MNQIIPHHQTITKVKVPPSKSYAQRAILAASLGESPMQIKNVGNSEDVRHITSLAKQLGALVEKREQSLMITGRINSPESELNIGESGLGCRLIGPIAGVLLKDYKINGEGSILDRSMAPFLTILPQIGLKCHLNKNKLPARISGVAQGGEINIDGSMSSQYLSGLLMALPLLNEKSNVKVVNLTSRPYIDITLDVLRKFNIQIEEPQPENFIINGTQNYQLKQAYTVEGDYSGASIWMVHGALKKGIQINGLNPLSVQGDKAMLIALKKAGVNYEWVNDTLTIYKSIIQPFNFDATNCPDLFPSLVVLAAAAKGTSTFLGVNRLSNKESDRGLVLQEEFTKLGLNIQLKGNQMVINGTGDLKSGKINAHNDHRIAMAGAIAAGLTNEGAIEIIGKECTSKSYPEFWEDFDLD